MSSHWLTLKSEEFTLCSGSFKCKIHLVTFLYIFLLVDCFKWGLIDHKIHVVTFLYILLLVDCFKWGLIDHKIHLVTFLYIFLLAWLFQMSSHWPHWKVKGSLWALLVSNGGLYRKIHLVTFLYIFLLVDCFKWALIDRIEKQRVHSVLCQFQM